MDDYTDYYPGVVRQRTSQCQETGDAKVCFLPVGFFENEIALFMKSGDMSCAKDVGVPAQGNKSKSSSPEKKAKQAR